MIGRISTVELSDGGFVNRFSAHVTFVKWLNALLAATVPTLEGHVPLSLQTDGAKQLVLFSCILASKILCIIAISGYPTVFADFDFIKTTIISMTMMIYSIVINNPSLTEKKERQGGLLASARAAFSINLFQGF